MPKGEITHSAELLSLCREAGADDAGFVELEREALAGQKEGLRGIFPGAVTAVVLVKALNRPALHSPARNICSHECNGVLDELGSMGRGIISRLASRGVRGVSLPPVFPMDFSRPPRPPMIPSHKILAQEAGIGVMGLNRLILHPRFGSAVYLSTLLLDRGLESYGRPLPDSPCISCRLCVKACPVGAIGLKEGFDHQACANHNYRYLAPGFMHWVEALASSRDMAAYRSRFNDLESLSWWQSLSHKGGYLCNNCLSLCPAGEEILPEYRTDPKAYLRDVVRPLMDKPEVVCAASGSRTEEHVRANPVKQARAVGGVPAARQ